VFLLNFSTKNLETAPAGVTRFLLSKTRKC